jgi:predicted DNA-binding ribbon-helix-helix protein
MKSTVVKRSIVLAGHKTSVSLEDAFWEGLKDIAKTKLKTLSDLVAGIDTDREHANLSSAIRLFVLNHYQARRVSTRLNGMLSDADDATLTKPVQSAMA